MPIDPKKFKKIVSNHFDNLSEEEFLKTLQKSAPHLFDEKSVEKQDDLPRNEYIPSNVNIYGREIIFNNKKYWENLLKISLGMVASCPLVILAIINLNANHNTLASPVFTSKQKFQCKVNDNSVILSFAIGNLNRPLIRFIDAKENSEYSKMNRCQMVVNNINRYIDRTNIIAITTGVINGRSIICVSEKNGAGCVQDKYNGEIISLGFSNSEDRQEKFDLFTSAFTTQMSGRILIDRN
jgi:hypothetical protein